MKKLVLLFFSTVLLWGCTDNGPSGSEVQDFDRQAILENWADNIILPAFENFAAETESLKEAANDFTTSPNEQTLNDFREQWLASYKAWQHVSMFEMGRAMEIRYRDNINLYPTDTSLILENIETNTYNFELPSQNAAQGLPALDFVLYGLGENDQSILSFYTTDEDAEAYKNYVTDLAIRIDSLTDEVLEYWQNVYRDEFVSDSGNGANSSLNMMVNDYIFYYEKALRAGKIGIPAGVFSGSPLSDRVEAYYSGEYSKELFLESLDAAQNFFNGTHFGSEQKGESLSSYLEFLETTKDGESLETLINIQFETARQEAQSLNNNLSEQVETDNNQMLVTYDELQKNVVFMKVDMLQALNISVDYVDADGD
ncbi:imelysin family protein [Rhodohalobacter barkolensis]|uniref:Peptidase M75 superfamily protein n=1 Tax=Rhodohalobacter barkolensis TaxID=2053187 RepID=A0A2N0VJV4_9BACT|nr:imelysin family protein [Rhodohalobacter barkolensis]PKD44471.1 peptidase M75 superfamily protein [Rhodohalobacter barkolensis]